MPRKLNDPDDDGILEWTESVTNKKGNSPSITIKLNAIDSGSGFVTEDQLASNVSWLDYSVSEQTLGDGTLEATITITADRSELTAGNKYRIEIIAQSDGEADTQFTTLEVVKPEFFNIMGQEDKYRQENGSRVQRGGIARVVVNSNYPCDIDFEYVANPSDENNPTMESSIQNASENQKHHEFFFGVSPSSLYAFKTKMNPVGYDKTFESDIHYLSTGDTITIEAGSFQSVNTVETVSSVVGNTETTDTGSGTSSRITDDPETATMNFSSTETVVVSSSSVSSQSITIEPLNTTYNIS